MLHPLFHLFTRNADVFQPKGDLFEDRILGAADLVERVLEGQAHVQHPVVERGRGQVLAGDFDRACHFTFEEMGDKASDRIAQGGLARAVRTDDRDEFTLLYLQVDIR